MKPHFVSSPWGFLFVTAAIISIVSCSTAQAATRNWANTAGGLWEVNGNWDTVAPTSGDDARIYADGTYSVLITNSTADTAPLTLTIRDLNIGDSPADNQTVIVNFTNQAQIFTVRAFNIGNAAGGTPTLRIEQGSVEATGESWVGNAVGATGLLFQTGGSLIVSNSAARWHVGSSGYGKMTVGGGLFTVSNGRIFDVGNGGQGLFEVAGGTVNMSQGGSGNFTVGAGVSGATGTVVVSGGTLNFTNNDTQARFGGNIGSTGKLIVSNGYLNAYLLNFGTAAGGFGQYEIRGGTNLITSSSSGARIELASVPGATAYMIMSGGLLVVTNTTANNLAMNIGSDAGGFATNDTTGGQTIIKDLNVGHLGVGQWNIFGGSNTIVAGGSLRIGNAAGSTGTVVVSGGVLTVNASDPEFGVGYNSVGTLTVSNGILNANTPVILGRNSTGQGTWNIAGGTSTVSGKITMGRVAGSKANFLMNGGVLDALNTTAFNIGEQTTALGDAVAVVSNGVIKANIISVGGDNNDTQTGQGQMFIYGGLVSVTNWFAVGEGRSSPNASTGTVLISDSGIVELIGAAQLTVGNGYHATSGPGRGYVTNQNGGTIRFTGTNNGIVKIFTTGSSIVTTNAIIEYKDADAADLGGRLTNISYFGNNTFSLNNATNANLASYTFQTNTAPNFANLRLINGGSRWQSTSLTIGSGGSLLATNTIATVSGIVTNLGTIEVANSKITFEKNVVISGKYLSDPSTNVFMTNATVTASGYLHGGVGDLFQFERNFANQSTNFSLFSLSTATVLFTNGTSQHLFDLTGSYAFDRGTNYSGIAAVLTNFAIGTLLLSPNDTMRLTGGTTNALYVGAIDFGGLAKTNDLTLDINLYYDQTLAANTYLGGNTYDLAGAGMLIPYGMVAAVPEPSTLGFLVIAALGLAWRRKNSIDRTK